ATHRAVWRTRENTGRGGGLPPATGPGQRRVGKMVRLSAAATISPTGKAVSRFPAMAPRIRPGLNSAPSVAVTGTSPPRPKFERKRKTASEATLQDAATRPGNSAKMPTVAENEVGRPI